MSSRCQMRRQKAISPNRSSRRERWRSPRGPRARPSRFVPLPWAISGRPPPLPSMWAVAVRTRSPAAIPRCDEVVADGHEDLRFVGVEAEREDARRHEAAEVLGGALQGVDRAVRAGVGDEPDARCRLDRPAGELGRPGQVTRGTGAQSPAGLVELVLEGRDPVRQGLRRDSPRLSPRPRARVARRDASQASAPSPGERLDPAHPGADAPLAGDHEAPDLAGRPAVGPAAQLVAVAVDPDRADRLAVLLVEEGVGAGVDRLAHRHERRGHRSGRRGRSPGPRPRWPGARRRSGRARAGSRSAARRESRANRPAGRVRRRRCAAPGGADACRCGCASCRARRSASTSASTRWPTRSRPCRSALDDSPRGRPLRVRDLEDDAPPPARSMPRSPTWPPPSA